MGLDPKSPCASRSNMGREGEEMIWAFSVLLLLANQHFPTWVEVFHFASPESVLLVEHSQLRKKANDLGTMEPSFQVVISHLEIRSFYLFIFPLFFQPISWRQLHPLSCWLAQSDLCPLLYSYVYFQSSGSWSKISWGYIYFWVNLSPFPAGAAPLRSTQICPAFLHIFAMQILQSVPRKG